MVVHIATGPVQRWTKERTLCFRRLFRTTAFQILFTALAARFILVLYSNIHDYLFHVNFTDIDYTVYSDAAKHVGAGRSPFDRDTYRYTPALAWILLPNNNYQDFGKYLFCIFDIIVAWMYYSMMSCEHKSTKTNKKLVYYSPDDWITRSIVICWLANPLTAIISARGSADVLVCAAVLLTLYLLQRGQWISAAVVHGALAVHLKIYPVIYLPSIFLHLCQFSASACVFADFKRLLSNWKGFTFAALLRWVDDDEMMSKLLGFVAFLPQMGLVLYFAFNQYFVWYICLLPLITDRFYWHWIEPVWLILVWFGGQGVWLFFAYLYEFRKWRVLTYVWVSSILFLMLFGSRRASIQLLMVFYLIGLGLGDVEDITVKGLKIVRKCKRVHLEAYTSILCYGLDKTKLEEFYGREVIEADRTVVEQNADEILDGADVDDVAMLVVKVIHNTSIMNAVGCCGLQLYNFGETVSIVMWLEGWEPDSYYDKIASNMEKGFHTLCLLDIKTKEQSIENMMKGRKIYEPPRYLTCAEAASQLLKIAERKKQAGVEPLYNESSPCVGLARVGWDDQKIVYCTLKEMSECDLGPPLHSMILPGNMHPLEIDMLNTFKL
ncbi:unnamed protein product [Nippostrongylus brasiliensis]|uniref:GPI alpha-1,4-mannosyltransferase I, catalytic subunit n=1 Tax=Nippostrongylus brasiliensis TaxID=27835 RepID=A0A158R2C0_NIPBR|nr:unnamed protein product [Nippostrongylus brasiliensis]